MTMSEFMVEAIAKGEAGPTYAGGMTRGDVEAIKAADEKFRKKRETQRGTATA